MVAVKIASVVGMPSPPAFQPPAATALNTESKVPQRKESRPNGRERRQSRAAVLRRNEKTRFRLRVTTKEADSKRDAQTPEEPVVDALEPHVCELLVLGMQIDATWWIDGARTARTERRSDDHAA